jgi:two-component system cell cycle response regulator DivK
MSDLNNLPEYFTQKSEKIRKVILIVEDNPLNMKMVAAIVAAQGYKVLEATTGLSGLELARGHHPALIIMDLRLPDVSGLEITRLLKKDPETADIPVIAASAHAASDEEALEAGCDAFTRKPMMLSDFIQLLGSLTRRGAPPQARCTHPQP